MFGAGFGGFAIRRIRQAQQQDSHILILRWIANPPNIRRYGAEFGAGFGGFAIAFPFGQRPFVPPNIRCNGLF
jgi:hypothetical protein